MGEVTVASSFIYSLCSSHTLCGGHVQLRLRYVPSLFYHCSVTVANVTIRRTQLHFVCYIFLIFHTQQNYRSIHAVFRFGQQRELQPP